MIANQGELRQESGLGAVRFERRFEGSPSELWPYLTDSERLSHWITPGSTIEPREGGRIVFPWRSGPPMEGVITVFDPPGRLEYVWREGPVESLVRMELRADGSHTLLIVDHSGLPLGEYGGFAAGWHSHLEWLEHVLGGRGVEYDHEARFNELAKEYGWERGANA